MKTKIILLFFFITISAFSQKCKPPMILLNESFPKKYEFKRIKYHNQYIVSLSYSKLTIKELFHKIYNKKATFVFKDKKLDTLKMSFIINCDSITSEKDAQLKLVNFVLDFYHLKKD